jgi:hypothetical protein
MAPEQLADGLWRWTARHPEWHPGDFGNEVASFALQAGGDSLLIDPLLPDAESESGRGPVWDLVDATLADRLAILITIPYHVRSSEAIRDRYRAQVDATIWGHRACAKRLRDESGFHAFEPGEALPAGLTAHRIGKPRRHEMPLHVPSQRALVFGDAVAEVDGALRVWAEDRVDAKVERFYRERFNPTLEPLLELDVERVLVTHGQPVMRDGRDQLAAALRASPWSQRG